MHRAMPLLSTLRHALARRMAIGGGAAAPAHIQRTLVVSHHRSEPFVPILENSVQALRYAGQDFDVCSMLDEEDWPSLGGYRSVVLATNQLERLSQKRAAAIASFVKAGGGLVVAVGGQHPRLLPLLGERVSSRNEDAASDQSPRTLRFASDLFPGLSGLAISFRADEIAWPFPGMRPFKDSEVIADLGPDRPLAWRHQHGLGRVVYWNSHFLSRRQTRGLLIQSLMSVQPVAVMSIANAGVIQVDDFPSGIADLDREPIRSEFGMTVIPFLDRIWLPDILQLGHEFGIPFSFFAPFNYNTETTPPFDFREWEANRMVEHGQDILFSVKSARTAARQGELGLHGYNHIPLTIGHWHTRANMVAGLRAAMERWQADELGPLPTSFVPAMNHLDADGALALTEAQPSLKTICSMHWGSVERGEGREFGPEPWNPALFALPRMTCGYEMTPFSRLTMVSQLATQGVWTHFIHPDDIIDNPVSIPAATSHRNPNTLYWRGRKDGNEPSLLAQLRAWFDFTARHFPWLRYVRTSDAADLIKRHLANRVRVMHDGSTVVITSDDDTDVQVRINARPAVRPGAWVGVELLHHHRGVDYHVYTLRMKAGTVRLALAPNGEAGFDHGTT